MGANIFFSLYTTKYDLKCEKMFNCPKIRFFFLKIFKTWLYFRTLRMKLENWNFYDLLLQSFSNYCDLVCLTSWRKSKFSLPYCILVGFQQCRAFTAFVKFSCIYLFGSIMTHILGLMLSSWLNIWNFLQTFAEEIYE